MNIRHLSVGLFLCFITVSSAVHAMSSRLNTLNVDCGNSESSLNRVLRDELALYLGRIFDNEIRFTSAEPADIELGTLESNPSVKMMLNKGLLELPQGSNSDQGYHVRTLDGVIYVAGGSDAGVLYGLYALLEAYGAYFQINGERLAARGPFQIRNVNLRAAPVFRYRGLLPWDNFACGMSGYGFQDYQLLIDRMVRMKFNKLQFHFYPGYAFFTEKWNGEKVLPRYIGQPVDTFCTEGAIGDEAFGDTKIFGCEEYIRHMGDPAAQAQAVQAMMRKVIDYAHQRGVQVVVGFELMVPHGSEEFSYTDKPSEGNGGWNFINPLDENNVDLSVERYRTLVETYPNADYYWLWQSEARGILSRNVGREPGAKEFREKYAHWAKWIPYGDGRIPLAGDIDYAYLFQQMTQRLTPQQRSTLATGGWSIEHLFPNIHDEIAEEVIFASLNVYLPPDAIEEQIDCFRVAEKGRRTWMIDWWEFDGDQWFPQFRVNWQEKMYDRCAEYGVEAVTLLGWKLTGIEHNIRYLSEYCWQPQLRGPEFYARYIEKTYGRKSEELEDIYNEYDRYEPYSPPATAGDYRAMLLGAGWTTLAVPELPGTQGLLKENTWQAVVRNTVDAVTRQYENLEKDRKAISTISEVMDQFDEPGRLCAHTLKNRLEFRTLYLKSMLSYNQGILMYDQVATFDSIENARDVTSRFFKSSLDYAEQAIQKYAQVVRHKTDLGVIAQLNEQFYEVIQLQYQKFLEAITFATVDWHTFELRPQLQYDFSEKDAWIYRDGIVQIGNIRDNGTSILSLTLGDEDTVYNSVTLHRGVLDLQEVPFLDFQVRTKSDRPMAFLFQIEGSDQYYALNVIGTQDHYLEVDSIGKQINDGKWHRITWNLLKMYRERISLQKAPILRNLIFGTWEASDVQAEVDFKHFAMGTQNTLD